MAMGIGAIGGALVGSPTYLFVGDISNIVNNFDNFVLLGIIIRVGVFALIGAFYAFVAPLPADRWSALERGIMAPIILATLISINTPNTNKLNKLFNSSSLVTVAYANTTTKGSSKQNPSPIRQIIRGILGK